MLSPAVRDREASPAACGAPLPRLRARNGGRDTPYTLQVRHRSISVTVRYLANIASEDLVVQVSDRGRPRWGVACADGLSQSAADGSFVPHRRHAGMPKATRQTQRAHVRSSRKIIGEGYLQSAPPGME